VTAELPNLEKPNSGPNNVTSTFFNTIDLLPKNLWLEHSVPNLLL